MEAWFRTVMYKAMVCLGFFLILFNLFFTLEILSPSWSTHWLFHIPYLLTNPLSPQGCSHPPSHQTSKLPGASSFLRLGASSLTEPALSSPLLYVCLISAGACCLAGGPVSEISGVQVKKRENTYWRQCHGLLEWEPFSKGQSGLAKLNWKGGVGDTV